jgi:hypothetical protein
VAWRWSHRSGLRHVAPSAFGIGLFALARPGANHFHRRRSGFAGPGVAPGEAQAARPPLIQFPVHRGAADERSLRLPSRCPRFVHRAADEGGFTLSGTPGSPRAGR